MKLLEIKIGELPSFIETDQYRHFQQIPITRERAISQYHNPNADKHDVGLIIALNDEGKVLGYIGILPEKIYWKNQIEKFYWNTCWWVDPLIGKKAAMTLFFQMLKITGMKQLFFELTTKTASVIEKLPYFTVSSRVGMRLFFRFYTAELLKQKSKFKAVIPVLKIVDGIGNVIWYPVRSYTNIKGRKRFSNRFKIESHIDDEVSEFIQPFLQYHVIRRGKAELNWIMDYPWLVVENENKSHEFQTGNYYFSRQVNSFRHYPVKLYSSERKMIAFLFMNERNGHFSIPYVFCEPEKIEIVADFVRYFLMKKKAKSFYTFNNQVLKVVEKWRIPHVFKKKLTKYMGFPTDDKYKDLKREHYQDGDGDVVFTG